MYRARRIIPLLILITICLASLAAGQYPALRGRSLEGDSSGNVTGFDNIIGPGGYSEGEAWSGVIDVAHGGTNATTADGARTNLGLGTMATQNANAVTLTGNATIYDDASWRFGTDADWLCRFVSSTSQFKCSTTNTGSAMTDADGMFTFQVNSGGGTLDDEQVVFDVRDYNTSLFKVDQDGDTTVLGELVAAQLTSTCVPTDNTCGINVANDGNPGSPVEGLCYYNRSTNLFLCYNGSTWESGAGGSIENEAFGTAWNGDTTNGAAKDNIYDWGHTFDTDDDGKVNVLDVVAGYPKTDSNGVVSIATAIPFMYPWTITDPADADDHDLFQTPRAFTTTRVWCLARGGGTIGITFQECDSAGASCGTIEALSCDSDGAASTTIDDGAQDADDVIRILYAAPSGTVNNVTYQIEGTWAQW